MITSPFAYLSRFSNFHFHPSFSVTVFVSTTVPFFNRLILISFGRFPSWLSASSQVFVPSTTVFPGSLVFVTVKPSFALPVTLLSYPFSTVSSLTVYTILFPALYSSRSVKLPVQLFVAVNVNVLPGTSTPSASNLTFTLAGLTPSWLSLSSQAFVTSTFVFPGVLVFVTVKPSSALPVTLLSYPFSTASSLTVYWISWPTLPVLYLSRLSKLPVQLFVAVNVNVLSGTSTPSASNLTFTLSGLTPSWLFASFQAFVTFTDVFSGSCLFVKL